MTQFLCLCMCCSYSSKNLALWLSLYFLCADLLQISTGLQCGCTLNHVVLLQSKWFSASMGQWNLSIWWILSMLWRCVGFHLCIYVCVSVCSFLTLSLSVFDSVPCFLHFLCCVCVWKGMKVVFQSWLAVCVRERERRNYLCVLYFNDWIPIFTGFT